MTIDYSHDVNRALHTLDGAREALTVLLNGEKSMLDVGCGTGTWLKAAQDLGVEEVYGLEGLDLPADKVFVNKSLIQVADLNKPVALDRRFDLVISFEAAEHIEPENAGTFVDTIIRHGDRVLFSAAAPDQGGTHHVNCRWPSYWQELFNDRGFVVSDDPRWTLWENSKIEPWYRQNMLLAWRDPNQAGKEPRIRPVIHPDALDCFGGRFWDRHVEQIEQGGKPWKWYVTTPAKAAAAKIRQKA